jgi:hypothetical protein
VLPLSSIPNPETHFSTWFSRVGLLTLRRFALALQQPPPSSNRKRCCQLITHVKGRPSLRDRLGYAKFIDYRSTDNWSHSLTWLCCARIQADNHQSAVASVVLLQDQPSPKYTVRLPFLNDKNILVTCTHLLATSISPHIPQPNMANARSKSPPGGAGDVSPTGNGSGSTATTKMRKRTKTGCLTCRKRRIKCGEERPTCANCIKSKRQCEGYNQRVIFKPPIGDWPNHPGVVSTIQYHTSMLPGTRNPQHRAPQSTGQAQEHASVPLQRRPSSFDISDMSAASTMGLPTTSPVLGGPTSYSPEQTYSQPLPSPHHHQPLHSPHHLIHNPAPTTSYFPQIHTTFQTTYSHGQNATFPDPQRYTQNQGLYQQIPVSYDSLVDTKLATSQAMSTQPIYQQQYPSPTQSEDHNPYGQQSNTSPREDTFPQYAGQRPVMQQYNSHPRVAGHHSQLSPVGVSQTGYPLSTVSHADFTHSSYPPVQIPSHDMYADVKYLPQPVLGMSHV